MGYHKQEKNNTAMKPSGKTMTVQDVVDLPCLAIEERGITLKTAKHFRIRTELDPSDGVTPIAHYFPYTENRELVAWKRIDLILPKGARGRITTIGSQGVKNDLCGTVSGRKSGGGKVFITEGEYDMAISWQALKEYLPSVKHTVLSISNGTANAVQNIGQKQNMKYLDKFDEIVSVFDNDRATSEEKEKGIMKGNEATAAVYGLIPELMVAQLPVDQDPCDVYNNGSGIENELLWMLYKPVRYTPEGFISFNDVRTKALELPTLGREWPWESVTRKTLGRRKGEGIYIGSGVKMGKCFSRGTVVRMHNGSLKEVQDICVGDKVMGMDSEPRTVLETHSGRDQLFEVKQTYGKNYLVNSQHTLVLKDSGKRGKLVERTVQDLYSSYGDSEYLGNLKGFHVKVEYPEQPTELDPYSFGVWLGDGSRSDSRLSLNADDAKHIIQHLGAEVTKGSFDHKNCWNGSIIDHEEYFKSFNKVKRIPNNYLINSSVNREELLAGWIDTDGYKHAKNTYEIITKDYLLALTGQSLIRSLGYKVTVNKVVKGIRSAGFKGEYYRLVFSGDFRKLPVQVPRKQCTDKPFKDPTRTAVKLFHRGKGEYFGFEVDGDHKFLLEDYTVVHNSVLADKIINHITTTETNCVGEPQKVAVFKFEEQPDETLKKIAGKFYKKDFSNPEKVIFINEDGSEQDVWGQPIFDKSSFFTAEELEEAIDSVGPQIILYNNYGRCHWDELKGAIRHAVLVEHVEDIFIDPITRLTAGMSAAKANEELERFSDEISKMSQDLGFTYYCFCHLKAPVAPQKPHEAGGRVYSSQFRGSRAMMQACHYMIGLEGDKSPEASPKVQNTRYFVILDDRKHGRTARIALFYDEDTGDFIEPPEGFLEAEDCDTLKEWYELHPEGFKPKGGLI